jgi:hypothetical protein
MEAGLLFESFLVFYLLECLVLILAAVYYYHEPKTQTKKVWDPWGFFKE